MKQPHKYPLIFGILTLSLLVFFLVNIGLGSVNISTQEIIDFLISKKINNRSHATIFYDFRLPKAITAIVVGSGLGLAGLLMQTFFRNPIAGPYVLGLSSGASLGVAILTLGISQITAWQFLQNYRGTTFIFGAIGSLLVFLAILLVTRKINNNNTILIIGIMFSSIASAMVGILSYFANPDQLQQFVFWGFGNLGNLTWEEIKWLLLTYLICVVIAIKSIKALNGLLLGENYAKSLGHHLHRNRLLIITVTCLLTGVITSSCGPIAFVGLIAPYLTKIIFNTVNHKIILPGTLLLGACLMLICDSIAQLPPYDIVLPINAVTAIIGSPIVVILLLKFNRINL